MSLLASLVGPVAGLLDKVIPDKDQAAALAHEIATMSERHSQDLVSVKLATSHCVGMRNRYGAQLPSCSNLRCV
jgi:hypothetical protein